MGAGRLAFHSLPYGRATSWHLARGSVEERVPRDSPTSRLFAHSDTILRRSVLPTGRCPPPAQRHPVAISGCGMHPSEVVLSLTQSQHGMAVALASDRARWR